MVPERLRERMYTPGVAEFPGSGAGCLPESLSTMLMDTSMNSSSDGKSSSLKRRHLVSSAELVAERRSNTDLVCVGDEQVTWLALRFLFNCSRRSGPGDVDGSS